MTPTRDGIIVAVAAPLVAFMVIMAAAATESKAAFSDTALAAMGLSSLLLLATQESPSFTLLCSLSLPPLT